MRIGDVGSISPSGELVAFALAVSVVLALSIYLTSLQEGEEPPVISAEEIRTISLWKGLDPDQDGLIMVKDGELVTDLEKWPFPLSGRIGLVLSHNDLEMTWFCDEGVIIKNVEDFRISSEVHGLSILIKTEDATIPGVLSLFRWEGDY